MRQAMKLGFLGVILTLVAAFGVLAGSGLVSAQATKSCTGSGTGGTLQAGGTTTCTITATTAVPAGGALVITPTSPAGSLVTACTAANTGGGDTGTVASNSCVISTPAAGIAIGGTAGTETIVIPAGATIGTAVMQTVTACSAPPAAGTATCPAGTTLASGTVTATGTGGTVAAPPVTAIPTLAASNFTKTCAPTGVASTASPIVTTCVLTLTTAAPGFPAGVTVTSDTITAPNAVFSCLNSTTVLAPNPACSNFGVSVCTNGAFTTSGGTTLSCTLPTITVTGATNLSECVTVAITAGGVLTTGTSQTICGVTTSATAFPGPAATTTPPLTATMACTGGGATTVSNGFFTLPVLASSAATCTVNLFGPGGVQPVEDGTIVVSVVNGTGNAVLGCDGASVAAAAGACNTQSNSQIVNIPCGTTAPAGTTASSTCKNGSFTVESALSALLANPAGIPGLTFGPGNQSVTLQVTFLATPGNEAASGGAGATAASGGGINLGTFTINFAGATTGTLLVGCTPSVIPSNGTLASVCTAQFATAGLTLSTVPGTLPVTTTGSTTLAAFLPGTFTFTADGEAIFDNGRSQESVPCGVGSNVSSLGVGSAGFNGFNAIAPVTFSCTGASVLAIGNGAAGNAAINVTYTSAVGGFQAVGSTLLTAVPSGSPKISLSCVNPATGGTTIIAGGQGAICTATVTDQNGVPLTGVTGAGVTFSVNNPAAATVIPCTTAISVSTGVTGGSCSLSTSVVGGLTAGLVAGTSPQTFTIAGGIAQAIVVANPGAAGQTVTVTASLGVFVPPSFLCFLGTGSVGTSFANVAIPSNCGTAVPFNATGLATALNVSSLGFGGVIALPNATSASATLTISGGATVTVISPTSTTTVGPGCVQVIVSTSAGTQVSKIAATVTPASAVVSIWRFNNSTKTFQAGYFSDPNAPTDFTTTAGGTETYFVCLQAAATLAST